MSSGELVNYLRRNGCIINVTGNANVIRISNPATGGAANIQPGLEIVFPFTICAVCFRLGIAPPSGVNCAKSFIGERQKI